MVTFDNMCRTANGSDIWFKNSFEKNLRNWINDKPLYDDILWLPLRELEE